LAATIVVALGSMAVVGGTAHAAGTGGAPGGTFTATCVSGPISETRTFTAAGHAPDSVAPGATFSVGTNVSYPVFANATAGVANYRAVGADLPETRVVVPGGAPEIAGPLTLTATAPAGSAAEVVLDSFGAGLLVGGHLAQELCTPDHTLVVARVGIGVPLVSIGDAAVVEGGAGTRALEFAVSLSRGATTPVTVAFDTEDGSATAGPDYVAQSGSVTFQPGLVSALATIKVRVRGDSTVEPKENLRVRLHDPVGAVLGRGVGTGRIIDDDPEHGVRLSVGDGSVVEGARGTRSARFTVSLSAPATQRVTFHFSASDGTAVSPGDYHPASYDGFIDPGQTSVTWPVAVTPNRVADGNRQFAVHLTAVTGAAVGRANGVGTIIDDD